MSAPTFKQLAELGLYPCQPQLEKDTECSICQENVVHPVMTQCFHKFCFDCLYEWLCNSTACPICRLDLEEALNEQLRANTEARNTPAAGESSVAPLQTQHHVRRVVHEDAQRSRMPEARPSVRTEHIATPTVARQRIGEPSPTQPNRFTRNHGKSSHDPLPSPGAESSGMTTMEKGAEAALARVNGGLAPCNASEYETSARLAGVISVDSTRMITDMLLRSNEFEAIDDVPLLWSESSAKVLHAWRSLLRREDGRTLLANDLLEGMYQRFRRTIVSYGYWDKRAAIPEPLDNVMRQVAIAAIHGSK